jgi:hypothetical protein
MLVSFSTTILRIATYAKLLTKPTFIVSLQTLEKTSNEIIFKVFVEARATNFTISHVIEAGKNVFN